MEGASTKTTTSSKNPAAPGGRGLVDPRRTLRIQLERIDGKRPPPSQIKVEPQAPPQEQDPQAAPGLVCTCILLFLAVPVGPPQLSVISNFFWREALSTNHTCMYQFLCSLPSMPSSRQSRGWWGQAKWTPSTSGKFLPSASLLRRS